MGLLLVAAACRPTEDGGAPGETLSPAETARLLHDHFQRRAYEQFAPMIVESARAETIELLRSVVEVLEADASLQQTAEEVYGVPYSATWTLGSMANNLGVFSRRMQVLHQRFRGAEAFVTLQEADHVPLVHARFVLQGDRWLYRPEEHPPSLAADLRKLAAALREVEEGVRKGNSYEDYLTAFFGKAVPHMLRVATAGQATDIMAAGEQIE